MSGKFDEAMNDMLRNVEAEARKSVEAGTDKGHNRLMEDLTALFQQAKAYEFHDMLNEKYPMPKQELYKRLQAMAYKVTEGDYDND